MGSEKHLLYFIVLVIAVVFINIAVYAYRNRRVPGAPALIVLLLAAMGYAVPYTLQMTSPNLAIARLWYLFSIPGANLLAPAWLIFSLTWSGGENTYSRRQVITFLTGLLFIPMLVCLAAWTNTLHSLYGNNFLFDPQKSIPVLVWDFGIFYWVGFLYAYGVLSVGLIILLNKVFKRLRLFFQQSMLMLVGALIPVFINIAFAAGFSFIPGFDLAPYTFLVTGIIWSIAVFRFHFLEIVPIAHQRVFKQMPTGMLVLDNQMRVMDINPAACEIMNLSALRVIGQQLPAEFAACLGELIGDDENITRNKQITHLCQQEKPRYLNIQTTALYDRKKNHIGSLFLFSDITEKKQSEEALQESEIKFRSLFEASPIGIELFDADGILRDANATCLKIFGLTNIAFVRGFKLFNDPNVSESIKRDLVLGKSVQYESEFDFDLVRKQNLYPTAKQGKIFLDTQITPLLSSKGAIYGYMVQLQDISERKKMEERLRYQSTHDALTGLFNRRYFETEMERLQNSRKYPVGILVIDMDGLKQINDTLGHSAGDELLKRAAAVIRKSFRPEDMVARIGGDEFVVVLPQTNATAVGQAVERLKGNIRENNASIEPGQQISLSIGKAISENKQTGLKTLFKQADNAMYMEKAKRKIQTLIEENVC